MTAKRKLLVLAHLYAPDVASTASLYQQLCESFTADYEVTAICVSPCYAKDGEKSTQKESVHREDLNGVHLIRLRVPAYDRSSKLSRVKHLLTYFFKGAARLPRLGRQDAVLCLAQPPIFAGLLGVLAKWITRGKLIYNVQDFNPEQIEVTHYSGNQRLLNLLRAMDNFTCRRSDHVIVVSRDMQNTLHTRLKEKGVPPSTVISNWADTDRVIPVDRKDNILVPLWDLDPEKFLVVYAGNFGLLQNLPTVIRAAQRLQDLPQVQFIMIGTGAAADSLREQVQQLGLSNVIFKPYRPMDEIHYVYSLGDVELVTIGPRATVCSMPSKTWNILSCGRPVVCQIDPGTWLSRMLPEEQVGFSAGIDDDAAMAQAIRTLYEDRELRLQMGRNARALALRDFGAEKNIAQYHRVLADTLN